MKPDIETIFMNASKTMMENLGCMRKALYEASEGLVHFIQSSILPF